MVLNIIEKENKMVKIIADSCCDLSPELLKQYDIEVIPLSVFVNDQYYLDGIEITSDKLFDAVKETGVLPKTSAPSVAAFTKVFQKYSEFVSFSISSKLSASYQSSVIALQSLPNHKGSLIDSNNLSTGIGLLVLHAAELAQQGKSVDEITSEIKSFIPNINTSFVIDTLDYLYMGGRCSAMEHVVGSLLKIRPVVEVKKDGTLGVKEKVSGSRKKALKTMLDDFAEKKDRVDPRHVFVTHTSCPDDAEYLCSELKQIMNIENLHITEAGSTIASHCGPNTIGILFLTK
jgi:DegV family protein with EDD domain